MIAIPKAYETIGCCCSCGVDLERRDHGFWHGARLCRECLTDIREGERIIAKVSAAQEWAEVEREWNNGQRSGAAIVALVLAGFLFAVAVIVRGVLLWL